MKKMMLRFKTFAHNLSKDRIWGLDIIRSIAILLVVYGHGSYLLPADVRHYYMLALPNFDGVSMFFVLSGFLIGGILLKIVQNSNFTREDLVTFWTRRWFRTLPNYYLVLGLLLLHLIVYGDADRYVIKYFIFFQNFAWPHHSFFPEAWSLCVEEWFYFLFPLTIFFISKIIKRKHRAVLIAALIFTVVPFLFRLVLYLRNFGPDKEPYWWEGHYRKVVILCLDSLMYGVICAYIYKFQHNWWKKIKKIGLILSIAIIIALTVYAKTAKENALFFIVFQLSIESLATALMLPYFSDLKSTRSALGAFFFTGISILSYSMYLLNYSPVQLVLMEPTLKLLGVYNSSNQYLYILKYVLYWIYVIGGSILLYRFYEKPMTALRDKK